MGWKRDGGQQDCSGRKSSEGLLPWSGVGEVGIVTWVREDGSGDSKHSKELAIDLERSSEEGSPKMPLSF